MKSRQKYYPKVGSLEHSVALTKSQKELAVVISASPWAMEQCFFVCLILVPILHFTTEDEYYIYDWVASGEFEYFDTFKDPVDLRNWWEEDLELPGGTPYDYGHTWKTVSQIKIQGGLVKRPEQEDIT